MIAKGWQSHPRFSTGMYEGNMTINQRRLFKEVRPRIFTITPVSAAQLFYVLVNSQACGASRVKLR